MTYIAFTPPNENEKIKIYKPVGSDNVSFLSGQNSDLNSYDLFKIKSGDNAYWEETYTTTGYTATELTLQSGSSDVYLLQLKAGKTIELEYYHWNDFYDSQNSDYHDLRATLVPVSDGTEANCKINDSTYGEVTFEEKWYAPHRAGQNTSYAASTMIAIIKNTQTTSQCIAITFRDNSDSLSFSGGNSSATTGKRSSKCWLKITELE